MKLIKYTTRLNEYQINQVGSNEQKFMDSYNQVIEAKQIPKMKELFHYIHMHKNEINISEDKYYQLYDRLSKQLALSKTKRFRKVRNKVRAVIVVGMLGFVAVMSWPRTDNLQIAVENTSSISEVKPEEVQTDESTAIKSQIHGNKVGILCSQNSGSCKLREDLRAIHNSKQFQTMILAKQLAEFNGTTYEEELRKIHNTINWYYGSRSSLRHYGYSNSTPIPKHHGYSRSYPADSKIMNSFYGRN